MAHLLDSSSLGQYYCNRSSLWTLVQSIIVVTSRIVLFVGDASALPAGESHQQKTFPY